MKKIKFSYIILTISLCAVVLLSLHIYKQRGYKQSIDNLFGKDNYIVEATKNDDDYTKIYTLDNKEVDGFKVFENYMESKGYYHCPDEQAGMIYTFRNKDGKRISCDSDNVHRGYIEWYICWNG